MPVTPYISDNEVLQFQITAGALTGLESLLLDADVSFELNKIPTARFTFKASNLDLTQEQPLESENIEPESELLFEINVKGKKKTLFSGIVKSVEKKYARDSSVIKIECKDNAYKLTAGTAEQQTNELTFDEQLEALAQSLTIDGTITGKSWGSELMTMNTSVSPWDFILSYLDAVGIQMACRNGTLAGVDILGTQEEKYNAKNGTNVFGFSAKADPTKKLSKVSIDFWDPASQSVQKVEAEQNADTVNVKSIKISENRFSQSVLTLMADAALKKSELTVLHGKITTFGNLEAAMGNTLTCTQVHRLFDDKTLLISGERHIIENGNWKTEYTIGVESGDAFANIALSQAKNVQAQLGQVNHISGLAVGTVLQLEEDPLSEFRIKVRIPSMAENGEGVWARLATLNASSEMGSFFIPDVDDEVLVGCIDGNPDNPVILGSLYSSAHVPPYTITQDNFIKGFTTKTGNKIRLDDENNVLEFSTEKGNKILISDQDKGLVLEDENKNKLILNDKGITIESSKDIIIKAKGNLTAEAAAFKMKASGNMELKGSMIKLN